MLRNEYISSNNIPGILETNFPSTVILHKYNANHYIIKVQIKDIVGGNVNIMNWKYNRPPDMTRCVDIATYIYMSKKPIDSMFYLSYNNVNESYEVIDGIHRYTALKYLKDDYISYNELDKKLDDAVLVYEQYILLNVRFNSLEEDLIGVFKNLNKSNPVPELYFRDSAKERKEVIEAVVGQWQTKYKSHFSANKNPNIPNANRDRFVELLDNLYDKLDINEERRYILEEALDNMNEYIKQHIPRKISDSTRKKCNETGCYLFLFKMEKLEEVI